MNTKMIRKPFVMGVFISLSVFSTFESIAGSATIQEPLSAKSWFKNSYAPLWKSHKTLQLEKLRKFYHASGFMRDQNRLTQWQIPSTLENLIAMVKDKGWQTSKIISIQAQQINQSNVALTVVWQSEYSDQSIEMSCEWYLANFEEKNWIFTQHSFMNCL
ncbi:MAG: hypothetical protein ACI92E_001872 [Oceanicoccus sp.]|jgi:hypothetical protein